MPRVWYSSPARSRPPGALAQAAESALRSPFDTPPASGLLRPAACCRGGQLAPAMAVRASSPGALPAVVVLAFCFVRANREDGTGGRMFLLVHATTISPLPFGLRLIAN